ncbi:MAG: SPFH domain-containing protein [Armatimonadetes bacterium]|nr:SPFH domain-containing protein [Armatimonadota bacterium]
MIRQASQWEKALIFRLGKYQATRGPGLFVVLPFVETARLIDTRITTIAIPMQQAITKDNVPVSLDGVIFLRVDSPAEAIIRVQDYQHAIRQYAQTALRDVIGAVTLDEILADREGVGKRIEQMVDEEIVGWGLQVAGIRIQDLILPEDLKKVMARQASAEREKRANITKSEGDLLAANNLAEAAAKMTASPGALQLRTLQTLDSLGSSPSNTVVMAVPVDLHDTTGMTALALNVSQQRQLPAETSPAVGQFTPTPFVQQKVEPQQGIEPGPSGSNIIVP